MTKKRRKDKQKYKKGSVEGFVLLAIVLFSVLIAGGLYFTNLLNNAPPPNPLAICCDTADCHPLTGPGQTLQFTSPTNKAYSTIQQYDLLKSNTHIHECFKHGKYNNQTITYPDGKIHPIIYNNSQELGGTAGECAHNGVDQIADYRTGTKVCTEIPDDVLVYVCVQNCEAPFGTTKSDNSCDPSATVYGNASTVYDVYMRHVDYPTPGVPDVIKNCQAPTSPTPTPDPALPVGNKTKSSLLFNSYDEHKTLQLHTFQFQEGGIATEEPRPFCKPALYFYPQTKQDISVKLHPQGKLIFTIPTYPKEGWHITAYPNGDIYSQDKLYDYLYYEAAIRDDSIPKETTGYVIAFNKLSGFFTDLLPKLGLNVKEQKQFSDYWLKALPNSPYYKISVIPQADLDQISPLLITPQPNTVIRVTLNFEPLDSSVDINPPALETITRNGFTVVEWAGMYKKDKNHPFTCLQ